MLVEERAKGPGDFSRRAEQARDRPTPAPALSGAGHAAHRRRDCRARRPQAVRMSSSRDRPKSRSSPLRTPVQRHDPEPVLARQDLQALGASSQAAGPRARQGVDHRRRGPLGSVGIRCRSDAMPQRVERRSRDDRRWQRASPFRRTVASLSAKTGERIGNFGQLGDG